MTRDLLIHHLVAIDAQLRRIRRLANSIGDGNELKVRLPPLIEETCHRVQVLRSEMGQQEGD